MFQKAYKTWRFLTFLICDNLAMRQKAYKTCRFLIFLVCDDTFRKAIFGSRALHVPDAHKKKAYKTCRFLTFSIREDSGGLLPRATDSGSGSVLTCPLGAYTLGAYTLGAYSLGLRILDLADHLPVLEEI